MAKNADSALKLGQARGSDVAAVNADLPVHEYVPVWSNKRWLVMVALISLWFRIWWWACLKLPKPQADAADALGVAITHANTNKTLVALAGKEQEQEKRRCR